MLKETVLYARFSSQEQAKGYSLERQITEGEAYIKRMGWQAPAVITDEAKSAFHGANRRVGSSLHEFETNAKKGLLKGTVLCVENIDRLSRQGAKTSAQLVWALNDAGVDVATWTDGTIYRAERAAGDNGMVELFTMIIRAERAHDESQTKSNRTASSWVQRYKDISSGTPTLVGQTPAWIIEENGQYVLHEDRARVLNEIYDLYIAGQGIYLIVQILNERGEPSWQRPRKDKDDKPLPSGGWYLSYVHRLLTRRTVIGEYVTLKGETLSLDYWPAAITVEKFNRAQAARAGKQSTGGGNRVRANNLLGGMVRCAVCDGPGGYENKGKGGIINLKQKDGSFKQYDRKVYEGLRCDRNRRKHACTNTQRFEYQVVEKAVLDRLIGWTVDEDAQDPKLTAALEAVAAKQRERAHTQERLNNLMDALEQGGSKTVVSRIVALEAEVEAHDEALRLLQRDADQLSSKPHVADDLEAIASLRAVLTSPDEDTRTYARVQTNTALKRVVESITLGEDGTFVLLTDFAVWQFDQAGKVIGSQAI